MKYIFDYPRIKAVIQHWLNTPPNGYRGVNYARNVNEVLMRPLDMDNANMILRWMIEDIPLLRQIPSSKLSIYEEVLDHQTKVYHLQIGQYTIELKSNNRGAN